MNGNELHDFWSRYTRVMGVYEAVSAKTGLSTLELRILDLVSLQPGCTQKMLCEATGMPKQRMSATIRRLTESGILETKKDERDGRSRTLAFTERGRLCETSLRELRKQAGAALREGEKGLPARGNAAAGVHTHTLEDGTVVTHAHAPGAHTHTHQNTKAVLDRLAKAIGHLEKVRNMAAAGEDCSEVLIQLAAVKSAINNTGKLILKDHIEHCLVDAIECGDMVPIEELKKAVDQFIK